MYIYILYYIIYTLGLYTTGIAHPSRIGAAMSRQVKEKLHHFDGRFRCNTKKKRIDHQISGLSHSL